MYLIMKTSPVKYDKNLIDKKLKTLNKFYEGKKKNEANMTRTDEIYFRYNLLYGTKSNQIIRAYSPKMRPMSASTSTFKKDNMGEPGGSTFSEEEVTRLYHSKCEDLSIKPKENLEKKFHDYCNLKCVDRVADFTECNFKKNSAVVLAKILRNNDKISHLKCPKNCFGDEGIEILMRVIKDSMTIVHLDFASNDISQIGGDLIFKSMINQQSIISLNLASLDGINRNRLTAEGIKSIDKVLKNNFFLEFLNLNGNSLKNEGLNLLLKGLRDNTTLHSLELANNEITKDGIIYFKTVLHNSKIMHLDLSDNKIGDEGVDVIGECISDTLNNITYLDLSKCNISFNGINNFFINIQNNKRIQTLNISNNNFSNGKFEQLKSVFSILIVKELLMSKCKLGNNGAQAVAEGFSQNNYIRELNISDNRIDDKGFVYFAKFPLVNYTLQKLDVSKNLISDESCLEFIRNLKDNNCIKKINFFDNQIRNETGSALIDILRTNKNITKINLKYTRIQNRLIEEIYKLLKKNIDHAVKKHIPNLKKEIRNIYVTNNDFEQTDAKINESGNNFRNLVEKLKEDTEKYTKLKLEEEEKVKSVEKMNEELKQELKEIEKLISENNSSLNQLVMDNNSKNVIQHREINNLQHDIHLLEEKNKELKNEEESVGVNFEKELQNKKTDLRNADKNYHYIQESTTMIINEQTHKEEELETLTKQLENPKIKSEALSHKTSVNMDKDATYKKKTLNFKSLLGGIVKPEETAKVDSTTNKENKDKKIKPNEKTDKPKSILKTEKKPDSKANANIEQNKNINTKNKKANI